MKLSSFESIIIELNDANVRYLIVGGLAVAAHGYGRVTFDVDLVLNLQTENIKKAIKALERLGYKPFIPVKALDFADAEKRKTWLYFSYTVISILRLVLICLWRHPSISTKNMKMH